MHRTQAAVYTPYPYYYPSHDPHLSQSSKCHRKSTLGTHGGVPRSQEVPPGLGGELGEEYGPIREDWGRNGAEIGLRRREQEGGEWE